MNPLIRLARKLTYRNDYSAPTSAAGLHVSAGRWGGRTVHDPRVRLYLQARRERVVREGLDPVDVALLDAATVALLNSAAVQVAKRDRPREVAVR